jgi:hypothetical protein
LNAKLPPKRTFDFRNQSLSYLTVDKFRLDKNTTIAAFQKRFARHYEEATRGTDLDVWTVLFLDTYPKSKHQWMLFFDALTGQLKKISYIKA